MKPGIEGREDKTEEGIANEYVIGASCVMEWLPVKAGVDYKNLTRICQHHGDYLLKT